MSIQLYFRPLACSMASRIALYEAGAEASFTYVERSMEKTAEGEDFLAVNPMALVPAVRIDGGEVLTENAAVLQYIADRYPDAGLAPRAGTPERYRMAQWLNFIASELHIGVFHLHFDKASNDAVKAYAVEQSRPRLARLEFQLTGRDYILDQYSVADIYLFVVLNWAQVTPIRVADYPALSAFMQRMNRRSAVQKALSEEVALYRQELAAA